MSITLPTSITGGAQTGFTTPGYTTTADQAPAANAKQVAVTALTGTQTGVTVHSVSSPFTVTFFKPSKTKTLPAANLTTGILPALGVNAYKLKIRKGALPAANQIPQIVEINCDLKIPVGVDTYSAAEVRAAISACIGTLNSISAGLGDTCVTNIM